MKLTKPKTPKLDTKALQIDKAEQKIIGIIVAATVVTVFCLVSSKALIGQALYQRKVVNARNTSVQTLNDDIKNANTLASQYNSVFIGSNAQNAIGGSSQDTTTVNGQTVQTSPPDGDNGRLVLDALPTSYDFPALLTSVSKMLTLDGITSPSIGGTDQSSNSSSQPSGNPQPQTIELTVSGTGTYKGAENFINDLQRSIRPFDVSHLTLSGNESSLTLAVDVTTYYQPAKTLNISGKEIK